MDYSHLLSAQVVVIGVAQSTVDNTSSPTETPQSLILATATTGGTFYPVGVARVLPFLQAITANCEPLPIDPWDRRPQPTAGRLANYLDIQIQNFVALALAGVKSRNYQKIQTPHNSKDLPFPDAA